MRPVANKEYIELLGLLYGKSEHGRGNTRASQGDKMPKDSSPIPRQSSDSRINVRGRND